jgi:hypothetical protein
MTAASPTETPEKPLWAAAGETITCLNGHPICDIAHDIHVGDGRSRHNFTNWRQPEPDRKTPMSSLVCTECRHVWVRADSHNNVFFHFAEGWR